MAEIQEIKKVDSNGGLRVEIHEFHAADGQTVILDPAMTIPGAMNDGATDFVLYAAKDDKSYWLTGLEISLGPGATAMELLIAAGAVNLADLTNIVKGINLPTYAELHANPDKGQYVWQKKPGEKITGDLHAQVVTLATGALAGQAVADFTILKVSVIVDAGIDQ